jgi:hypothetical protein
MDTTAPAPKKENKDEMFLEGQNFLPDSFGGRRHKGSKKMHKNKRHGNASLRAWVTFVKKVQKEEGIGYKEAMSVAKKRKDGGEKWRGGSSDEDDQASTGMEGGRRRRRRTHKRRGSKKRCGSKKRRHSRRH